MKLWSLTLTSHSFSVYAEPTRSFGEEKTEGFTGMIGQLQREESDLSTIVAPTPGRLKVVDYLRTYPSDPLILTSLKPNVLPAHLSLVRPFTGEVFMWGGHAMFSSLFSQLFWSSNWNPNINISDYLFLRKLINKAIYDIQDVGTNPCTAYVTKCILVATWLVSGKQYKSFLTSI